MSVATSGDGTPIAYETHGSGPPLVLVDGALCRRDFGPMGPLARALADRFAVTIYDRRGRGESGAREPYAVEREVDDLRAVIAAAGAEVSLYGISSGGALVLRALAAGAPVKRAAVYEVPFAIDGGRVPDPPDFRERIAAAVRDGRPDEAARIFLRVVGAPAFAVFVMRLLPNVWPKIRAIAPTLPHDFAILGETQTGGPLPDEWRSILAAIEQPTLVLAGGRSPAWMTQAARAITGHLRHGEHRVIPKGDHAVGAKALAPTLIEFFTRP